MTDIHQPLRDIFAESMLRGVTKAEWDAVATMSAISALLADLDAAVKENERLREEMARDVMSKTMLTDVTIQNGSMGIQVEGGAAGLLANSFAEQFIDSGAENYLEVSFHHKKVGGLTVTLQRNSGKTPHMLRAKAEAERDAAAAERFKLHQLLAMASLSLEALLKRDEMNTCQHEETHRGGVIWEICDRCGTKWADDQGGRPAWKDPAEWDQARSVLSQIKAGREQA